MQHVGSQSGGNGANREGSQWAIDAEFIILYIQSVRSTFRNISPRRQYRNLCFLMSDSFTFSNAIAEPPFMN
jgi:hypothetical protein